MRAALPAAPVAPAAPLLPAEPGEPIVSGAILPQAAHLHVSSETLGEIALHLRMKGGAAHIRVEADHAAGLEARAPELARALAAEGIGLARLDVEVRPAAVPAPPAANPHGAGDATPGGAGAGSGGNRDERPDAPEPRPSSTPSTPRPRRSPRTGLDVTA